MLFMFNINPNIYFLKSLKICLKYSATISLSPKINLVTMVLHSTNCHSFKNENKYFRIFH